MNRTHVPVSVLVLILLFTRSVASSSVSDFVSAHQLPLPGKVNKSQNASIVNFIEFNHYHNYTEITDTLLHLNETYPRIVDVFSIGTSWQNNHIYCIRLTNESIQRPKPEVLFVGYHHARELISAELLLYFLVEAANSYGTNEAITHMIDYCQIYIIVALNIDAFEAVQENEWLRKNVHPFDEDGDGLLDEDPPDDEDGDGYIEDLYFWNGADYEFIRMEGVDDDEDGLLNEDWVGGVDLNRNYGFKWNATVQSGSPYPEAEDFRGPARFSEPETQALRDLALQHDFQYAVSFHSGLDVILYPWGYTTDPTADDEIFREIASSMSILVGSPYEQAGQIYTTSGVLEDWMYNNRSTFAFTAEIYRNDSAWEYEPGPDPNTWWEKGIFQFFNPDPLDIEREVQRWLPVFSYIADRAIAEAYDLAMTSIVSAKTVVGKGFTANLSLTIENQGAFTETFNIIVFANTTVIATLPVSLTSKNYTTITQRWDTTNTAKGNYTISAFVPRVLGETDTLDNNLTDGWIIVAIAGDITGIEGRPDGKCNMRDVGLVARYFGQTVPPAPANCDVTGPTTGVPDGTINMRDVGTVARHFGETDP